MNEAELKKKRETIDELKKRLEENNEIYENLCNQICELESLISDKEKELQIYDYYDSVRKVLKSTDRFERKSLYYKTPTRDMMTNLKRGHYYESKCVLIDGKFSNVNVEYYVDYYLINDTYILLYKNKLELNFDPPIEGYCTVTEFKKGIYFLNLI